MSYGISIFFFGSKVPSFVPKYKTREMIINIQK